jgi:K+/H+ antiporter YhaU regulatory subunit KhtT
MKLEVSIGEAIDKLNILEIKKKFITNNDKQIEIINEIDALQEVFPYKDNNLYYYNLLSYINESIWNLTNIIKTLNADANNFSKTSHEIFDLNQKRFRIKNIFNNFYLSNIKEQKSYNTTHCHIIIDNISTFYSHIPEIMFLCLEYDVISFDFNDYETLTKIIKFPFIISKDSVAISKTISLSEFSLDKDIRDKYDYIPITYICGGPFGDFIQSVSVINETFLETGKKGILYITNDRSFGGDTFRNDINSIFKNIQDCILSQTYIKDFNIYNNQKYDINLNSWRRSPLLLKDSWHNIFKNTFNVNWGFHTWLTVPENKQFENKLIINIPEYRGIYNIEKIKNISKDFEENILFMSYNKNDYIRFINETKIQCEYYYPSTFMEECSIINSCKIFLGALSGMLTLAHALHKTRIILLLNSNDDRHNINLGNIWNNVSYI